MSEQGLVIFTQSACHPSLWLTFLLKLLYWRQTCDLIVTGLTHERMFGRQCSGCHAEWAKAGKPPIREWQQKYWRKLNDEYRRATSPVIRRNKSSPAA